MNTSSVSSACFEYEVFRNTRASTPGDRITSADTREECEDLCTDDEDCFGFDYRTTNDRCYHHTDEEDLDFTEDDDDYDHYVKQECKFMDISLNISKKMSSHSEAKASELLKNHEEMTISNR